MSQIQSVSDQRVKSIRGEDEEQHDDEGSHRAEPSSEQNLPAVRRRWFRVFTVALGVLYVLVLAGFITRYVFVTLEKEQLQIRYNNLKSNFTQVQETYADVNPCPHGWNRGRCSCYFKSSEKKTWFQSRKDCQNRGSDLVMINSKEEQDFVRRLSVSAESWIGVWAEWTESEHVWKWKWLDGTHLEVKFWATGDPDPTLWSYATCCDQRGRWMPTYDSERFWICEKKN